MDIIYEIRAVMIQFIKRYETILVYVLKFLFAFLVLQKISASLGHAEVLTNPLIILLFSILGAVISGTWFTLLMIFITGAHLFQGSLEVGILLTLGMLMVYLIYVRLIPELSYLILFVPFCYILKIPLVVPLFGGMFIGLSSIVPVALGTMVWHFGEHIPHLIQMQTDSLFDLPQNMINLYMYIMNTVLADKEMILSMVVFTIVIILSYIIRKMEFNYSWYAAIIFGTIMNIVLFIIGMIAMDVELNAIWLIVGSLLSGVILAGLQFFRVVLDYSRMEKVQFEDNEYYYYVKAVPKISMPKKTKRKIKKITQADETTTL